AKSTTALAAAIAMHRLDAETGVVICQSRIASLLELVHELVNRGVPRDAITLLHSDTSRQGIEAPDKPEPSEARRIVLMTHANVVDRGRLPDYSQWSGRPRVVLYDESLFTKVPASVELPELAAATAKLRII